MNTKLYLNEPEPDAYWDSIEPSDEDLNAIAHDAPDAPVTGVSHAQARDYEAPAEAVLAAENTVEARMDDLNTAVSAMARLYAQGKTELLDMVDPSGMCASGECNGIAAGFLLLAYQRRREPASTTRPKDALHTAMEAYQDGTLNMEQAAKAAGMRRIRFREALRARFGETRGRGKPMSDQGDAYRS
jgi:hypothetical protein